MKLLLENWRKYLTESIQELKDAHSLFIKTHTRPTPFEGNIFFKDHMHNRNSSIKTGREVENDPVSPLVVGRRIKIPKDFYLEDVAGEEGTITEIKYWKPLRGNPTMGFYIKWDNPQVERNFRTAYGMDRVSETTNDIASMITKGFEIQ
tara:strand:+ start:595 stop:1041 length:447 start_codon:yes stop_codon:yes gene_type:complete